MARKVINTNDDTTNEKANAKANAKENAMSKAITMKKNCTKCGTNLVVNSDNFYRDNSQKDGHSPWCKDCERAYNRAYRAGLTKANVDRVRNINDEKARKAFEKEMKKERVTRGANRANRVVVKARGKAKK